MMDARPASLVRPSRISTPVAASVRQLVRSCSLLQHRFQSDPAPCSPCAASTSAFPQQDGSSRTSASSGASPESLPRARSGRRASVVAAAAPAAAKAAPQLSAIPRGNTQGAALLLKGVTINAGDRELLLEVDWSVMPGQRVGLVGANGCGKSTLLKALCGLRHIDAGTARVAPKVEVGYLEQTAVAGSKLTVWLEVRSRMTQLLTAEAAMDKAEKAVAAGNEQAASMMVLARDQFEAAGGIDADKTIANVLTGLGFSQAQWHKLCSEFSGGWQMRIALARLLLGPAGQSAQSGDSTGLLLLDEPTNHLDSAATAWLGNFLRNSTGGAIIVSHDEALLESACDRITEVRGGTLHHFTCGYRKFLVERGMRETQARQLAETQIAEIKRLEEFVARFGAKASKASQAQSRQKQLDKMRENAVDIPAASAARGPGDARKVALAFPRCPPCKNEVLTFKNASIGWGEKVEDKAPLLSGVDLVIKKGQRILVLGPNGAGKSTLIKAMAGSIPLWGGVRNLGDGVQLGIFSQDLAQDLPLGKGALDYVLDKAREHDGRVTLEQGRAALGALGIQNSMALLNIGQLSGGEKARVALAAFALVPCNVLLLDEASNHCDLQTIEVLSKALQGFTGALIAITHNQLFANTLNATHILRVQDGEAILSANMGLSDGDFEHPSGGGGGAKKAVKKDWEEDRLKAKLRDEEAATFAAASAGTSPVKGGSGAAAGAGGGGAKTKRKGLGFYEAAEYKKIQKVVEQLTVQRDALQERVMTLSAGGKTQVAAAKVAGNELAKMSEELEEKSARWLELAELAGDL